MSKACEQALSNLLEVCKVNRKSLGKLKAPIKRKKRPMSGWICYLKTCAVEEPNMKYKDCMTNKERKEKLYYNNKAEWKKEALKGCKLNE